MARIRSIKPEFWVSEQIAECSMMARLAFIGMWAFCDDRGVHPAKPKTLKAELFPMDDCSTAEVSKWVGELINAGLIVEFTYDGVLYWHVTGWNKHQKIDRPSYKYPPPPARGSESVRRALDESSTNTRRAPSPGEESKGEESKGEESKGEENATSPKARTSAADANQGTRLPRDWALTDELRSYCIEKRPDLDPDATAENFRDYWVAKPGKDGRKTDWDSTWRRWVREQRQLVQGKSPTTLRRSALHADGLIGEAA